MKPIELVRQLYRAIRGQELDRLGELLDPEIEVEGLKGTFTGIEEVRRWATQSPDGELRMRIELDEADQVNERQVVAKARRQWRWRESGELADESPFGILFTMREGRIVRWQQRFDSYEEALAAAEGEAPAPRHT